MNEKIVLVTGGSGYIAGWIIVALLQQGYRVKTTIRKLSREPEVRATLAKHATIGDNLTFIEADLQADKGWNQAAEACEFVLHVASPMPIGDHAKADLVKSAREGTQRVLNAARAASVKRVVITSSVAACHANPSADPNKPVDESVWTDVDAPNVPQYFKSKTLAERDAWKFADQVRGEMEIATVLPSAVLGPVLGKDNSGSLEIVSRLLTGKIPALPNLGFNIVDVRDLVDLHIAAMLEPEAAGQRFIGTSNYLWMVEIASIIRQEFGARAAKVPKKSMPDFVLHVMAFFQPEYRQVTPNLGRKSDYTSVKARSLLGWNARPATETVIDCARSMLDQGLA